MVTRNKESILMFNILVFSESKEKLWKYRDLLVNLEKTLDEAQVLPQRKLAMTLVYQPRSVLDIFDFQQGGIDIYLSDTLLEADLMMILRNAVLEKHRRCHCIEKRKDEILHVWRSNEIFQKERIEWSEDALEKQLLHIIENWSPEIGDEE